MTGVVAVYQWLGSLFSIPSPVFIVFFLVENWWLSLRKGNSFLAGLCFFQLQLLQQQVLCLCSYLRSVIH